MPDSQDQPSGTARAAGSPKTSGHGEVVTLAVALLNTWARTRTREGGDPPPVAPGSGGPGIPALGCLLRDTTGEHGSVVRGALAAWTRTVGGGANHLGLHDGGLSGTLVGLRLAARIHPPLHRAADRLRDHLLRATAARPWRTEGVRFDDHDLIVGPSGTLLALLADGVTEPPALAPLAGHLTALSADGELSRLRVAGYAGHPQLGRLEGRINTGMGHGVAGLTAALTALVRTVGPDPATVRALRHTTRWLIGQSFDDARAIRSWDDAERHGPPPPGARARQAWCYGNPGVSWAVWDAADALGDRRSAAWAADAFTTLVDHYDPEFHLHGEDPSDLLGLCHGAGGVLAVADAFARHAGIPAAATLRDGLSARLRQRLPRLRALGIRPAGPLADATGPLCALLSAAHPDAPRLWQPCFGLR
ncbi:lanthionine synthetase LanC family protein [Streptomyces cucumeris]|uniref:lanthionine synthetase LanC family protein n=1 Tax=Streptomyces cucumeris TaxID=2962890 RepID=UPI003D759CA4